MEFSPFSPSFSAGPRKLNVIIACALEKAIAVEIVEVVERTSVVVVALRMQNTYIQVPFEQI